MDHSPLSPGSPLAAAAAQHAAQHHNTDQHPDHLHHYVTTSCEDIRVPLYLYRGGGGQHCDNL